VQVEADDVDAELPQPLEALVERAAAVQEPGVVLDPEADARRPGGGGRGDREQDGGEDDQAVQGHPQGGSRAVPFRHLCGARHRRRAARLRALRRFTAGAARTAANQT
jgi:hypothetical protein